MKLAEKLFGFSLLVLLAGCASMHGGSAIHVSSYHSPTADFSGLQTYDWLPNIQEFFGDSRVNKSILEARVHDAVNTELLSKGFANKTSGNPDFLVRYHAMVGDWKYLEGSGDYIWDTGSLILDVVEPKTQQLMWRGVASAQIDMNDSQENKRKKINQAVKETLAKFPPQ